MPSLVEKLPYEAPCLEKVKLNFLTKNQLAVSVSEIVPWVRALNDVNMSQKGGGKITTAVPVLNSTGILYCIARKIDEAVSRS